MVMHPLKHFVSASDGTLDALILRDIEDKIGSYAESLTSEAKLAFLAVLTRYLYFRQCVVPNYSIGQAIASTQMEADTTQDFDAAVANTTPDTQGTIWDIMLTLEGISNSNALGLLQFITQKHCHRARTPAAMTCFNCTPPDQLVWSPSESASVIDPGRAWLLRLPKDGFTMPQFSFGQKVMSRSRETIGLFIGMEFAPSGSTLAYQISCGWHYVIAVTEHSKSKNWRDEVDSVPESDLIITCGGEN